MDRRAFTIGLASFLATLPGSAMCAVSLKNRRVQFVNTQTQNKIAAQLITNFGTINNRSRQNISRLICPQNTDYRCVMLHPRLLLMLQRVADQFPGRAIEIVSGIRHGDISNHSDHHVMGRAVDFRISGVSNERLYEFIQALPGCGAGLYPKANFVHLDVREQSFSWLDHYHQQPDCRLGHDDHEAKSTGHKIDFVMLWSNQKASLNLVTDGGSVNNRSRQILSEVVRSRKTTVRTSLLHPRLIVVLQQIADQFPNKRFEVISGIRLADKGFGSYHNYGRAMDFRLPGVDNLDIWEFAKTIPKTGRGYYPKAGWVHVDVRDKPGVWVDYSGVGESSKYGKLKKGAKKKK